MGYGYSLMAHVELTIKNKEALGIKQEKQGNIWILPRKALEHVELTKKTM
jgi:hypothetical protein